MQRRRPHPGPVERFARGPRFVSVLLLVSCARIPDSVGNYAPPDGPGKAWIAATPNPIPAGRRPRMTTVSWDTGAGSPGFVFLSVGGGPEKPFSDGTTYTKDARVGDRGVHEFRLYEGKDRTKPLASVKVSPGHP